MYMYKTKWWIDHKLIFQIVFDQRLTFKSGENQTMFE